ncbi:hypothetical protein OXX79_003273 [Metschnikowia pulcherrima]
MNDNPDKPIKAKKKRSFFEDDFFVKKPRVKSLSQDSAKKVSSDSVKPEVRPTIDSGESKSHTQVSNSRENSTSTDVLSSEDHSHAYLSANESFTESAKAESPLVQTHHNSQSGQAPDATHVAIEDGNSVVKDDFIVQQAKTSRTEISLSSDTLKNDEFSATPESTQVHSKPTSPEPAPTGSTQEDEDDIVDLDLQEFFSGLAKKSVSVDEHSRLYRVEVSSRSGLHVTYERQITGDTTFGELAEQLSRQTLRDYNLANYWKQGAFVWIEGRSELKPIFKPSTLRIPEPRGNAMTKISCLHIPTEQLSCFEKLHPEFTKDTLEEEDDLPPEEKLEVYALSDVETSVTQKQAPEKEEVNKSEFFVIGLKGKDNKRIEAEVGPTTKIRSLLTYYMQVKGIEETPGQKGRIVFEDEELELDAVVADTELEEDFEVQVYI